ncbi:MAG: hypothetical protein VB092_08795 [Oscillospiraceae bacterium]|nr:hypothetical protein [Oscillospiraceae bacterium]
MKKTLPYFSIGGGVGGNQDWFTDRMMKLGGCAAECACDSSIYFALYREKSGLYPFDASALTKEDYIRFSARMKPYLRPRWSGIDRPQIYIDGYDEYLRGCGETALFMEALPGDCDAAQAREALRGRIDAGFPVPCLMLNHHDPAFGDYEWHWFLLTGYDDTDDFSVRAVTYGEERWLPFLRLWDTGQQRRGGLILYKERQLQSV